MFDRPAKGDVDRVLSALLHEARSKIADRRNEISAEVMASKDYVQEKEKVGPTMKQKVRFIMKKNGKRSSSDVPEQAIVAFEEAIAGLTRAVYELSSKAVHVAGERQAVMQLRRYVVAVFHDILAT